MNRRRKEWNGKVPTISFTPPTRKRAGGVKQNVYILD